MAFMPEPGKTIWGFTVTQIGTIQMLGAKTLEFFHGASGARLLYIQNDDQELGCNIIYRTPQTDETDANHVLEHLILSSCRKYPSRDIFFDMDNKSYSTFMNGLTDNTYTSYPLCTQSQDQLLKLMDVFLCCMESPDFLTERNFFLREGLRFDLESPDGPLTLQGTVLSEDWGHLTDIQEYADSFMAKALYPGMNASNLLGKAHLNYRKLNYQLVQEAFYRNYRYSNCLIVLYGEMEFEKVLEFLHREHLSPAGGQSGGSTVSGGMFRGNFPEQTAYGTETQTEQTLPPKAPTSPGSRELIQESPAYKGTPVEQAAVIDYAIDLQDSSQEELIYWDLFADLLDNDASPWHKYAGEQGLNYIMEVYLDVSLSLPALKFRLRNGDDRQSEEFMKSIRKGLNHIAEHGMSNELYQAFLKENRLSDSLTREASHLGFNFSEEIGRYWSVTGKTDYFQLYEDAFKKFSADSGQSIIKMLAREALNPQNSALAVTLPKPGLAEELECRRDQYADELFAAMTADERNTLAGETRRFREWNEKDWGNMDFLIEPEALPLPPAHPLFTKDEGEFITCYTASAPVAGVGSYQIYFDLSLISQEDLSYLSLYQMLLTELDTGSYTVEQQKAMEQEYLHECTFDEFYPGPEAGTGSRPLMTVFWYGLTEDFAQGLDFLLDVMGGSDYSDHSRIIRVLEKYLPDYDLSKTDNASSLAFSLAEGYLRREAGFRNLLNSQENYYFLKDLLKRLKKDKGFGQAVGEKLANISRAILHGPRVVFMAAASEDAIEEIRGQGCSRLRRLKASGPDPGSGWAGADTDGTESLTGAAGPDRTESLTGPTGPGRTAPTAVAAGPDQPETLTGLAEPGRTAPTAVAAGPDRTETLTGLAEPGRTAPTAVAAYTDRTDALTGPVDLDRPDAPPKCSGTLYVLPPRKQRLAVCVEASSQETRILGDFRGNSEFKGRFLPFLLACGDKYLKPSIRYQGGAYDSGADFYIPAGYFSLWSAADPGVKSTLDIFAEAGKAIGGLSLTQRDLDGYILSAYAQALPPAKALGSRIRCMHRDIAGIDTEKIHLMIEDIRYARLEDQQKAARMIQDILEHGPVVTVGNERCIYKDKGCFDEIVDYRRDFRSIP